MSKFKIGRVCAEPGVAEVKPVYQECHGLCISAALFLPISNRKSIYSLAVYTGNCVLNFMILIFNGHPLHIEAIVHLAIPLHIQAIIFPCHNKSKK